MLRRPAKANSPSGPTGLPSLPPLGASGHSTDPAPRIPHQIRRTRCASGSVTCLALGGGLLILLCQTAVAVEPSGALPGPSRPPLPRVVPLPPPGDDAWKPLEFRSIERKTIYELRRDPDERPAYRAVSHCSASAMLLPLPEDFDPTRTPRLAWRWRIEHGLSIEGEKTGESDDFAARVYVLFRFDPERASAWRRLQQRVGRRLFGAEAPGRTLSYVWSSHAPKNQTWPSPRQPDAARIVVLESGSDRPAAQAWREEIVDLEADPERFLSPPPRLPPYALGLMTDADDVCGEAIAWYSDFRLLGPELKKSTEAKSASPSTASEAPRSLSSPDEPHLDPK